MSTIIYGSIPGEEIWKLNGVIHRPEDQGPAIKLYTHRWTHDTDYFYRVVQYVYNGVLHRESGSAVIIDYYTCRIGDVPRVSLAHLLNYRPFLRLDIIHGVLHDYTYVRSNSYMGELGMYNHDVEFFNDSYHCGQRIAPSVWPPTLAELRLHLPLPTQRWAMPPHSLKKLCILEYRRVQAQAAAQAHGLPEHLQDEIADGVVD